MRVLVIRLFSNNNMNSSFTLKKILSTIFYLLVPVAVGVGIVGGILYVGARVVRILAPLPTTYQIEPVLHVPPVIPKILPQIHSIG